ncbi:UPF0481 protein At3g47200-like [Vitis riparia]|uniref:UPF0481 protein At3g47200-like n=1 Tax=Vitis riparia TaxID=96939 RepID=UPI00155A0D44|nr:UPF0481 protein At3g47200-like [Vitis riparia]
MGEMECVVQVSNRLDNMVDTSTEAEQWKKRSIYRVPTCVTDLNKKAYKPQAVSFGPYHHGEEHLQTMEDHKRRALLHFFKRSDKPIKLLVESLAEVVQDLKDSYDLLDPAWQKDTSAFLQLMIVDGCFMLEILRTATHTMDDYDPNDPIFSDHGRLYIMPYVRRDMLMLENQLPMLVLDKLLAVESDKAKDPELINKLILKFFTTSSPEAGMGKCLHVLDVYRKSLLQEGPGRKPRHHKTRSRADNERGEEIIRSATELDEAGIRMKKSRTQSLKDISFKGGVLKLPVIVVDDTTESMFLNLIAFERLHVGAGNEVTSFIFFMDNIIDNAKDVSLLHSRGIIQSALGSDKAVAKLFNSLSKDITLDPDGPLYGVHKRVNDYCRKSWNEWRANLIHTYFRNPWAILSLIAAAFLFALTIAQTVFTIYPYYHPSGDSSSSPSDSPPPKRTPSHH